MTIVSDSDHWYDQKGNPYHEVPYADPRKGMRATTLKDARKLNLVPSVTKIQKDILRMPALEAYKQRQILEAALTLPKRDDETLDEYAERVVEDSYEHSRKARDRGTELHTAIEKFILGDLTPEWAKHLKKLEDTLAQLGIDIRAGLPEHSFACAAGYGGKVDYHNPSPTVIDFKSKDAIGPKDVLVYDEHAMQISAYGSGLFGTLAFRGINVFVGVNDLEIRVHEHTPDDLKRGFAMFTHCLAIWRLKNRFGG